MTLDEIETRIAELTKLKETALANANALDGAIQDCRFWAERLKSPSEPVKPHLVES